MAYMDKERAKSAEGRKEYMAWLKQKQAETRGRRKAFVASTREYSKTLGKEKEEYGDHMEKYKELRGNYDLPLDKKTAG